MKMTMIGMTISVAMIVEENLNSLAHVGFFLSPILIAKVLEMDQRLLVALHLL